ncbi:MAG: hypothetical protein ABIW85_08470, partial [Variovorax sp.]
MPNTKTPSAPPPKSAAKSPAKPGLEAASTGIGKSSVKPNRKDAGSGAATVASAALKKTAAGKAVASTEVKKAPVKPAASGSTGKPAA